MSSILYKYFNQIIPNFRLTLKKIGNLNEKLKYL